MFLLLGFVSCVLTRGRYGTFVQWKAPADREIEQKHVFVMGRGSLFTDQDPVVHK